MKDYFITTAAAIVFGMSAYADEHTTVFLNDTFDPAMNIKASELIGMRVHVAGTGFSDDSSAGEWNDIGEVNDIVLSRSGDVELVILGVGGFIGIAEKDVAISMDQLNFMSEDGDANNYFLTINSDVASIAGAPEYLFGGERGARTSADSTSTTEDSLDIEVITESVTVDVNEANPNPVVPQNALIPPAPIKSDADQ